MDNNAIKQTIEALLLAANRPLAVKDLIQLLAEGKKKPATQQIESALKALAEECVSRGVELKEVASGYRYQTCAPFAPWVAKLWEEKPPRYSSALLETLALIAYRQPITRAEIEEVRGVAVSSTMIQLLEERNWIKVIGHKETPGRPALYGTAKEFLDYFNLRSLDDLPVLMDLEKVSQLHPELNTPNVAIATTPDNSTIGDASDVDNNSSAQIEPTEHNEH